jgi:Domain of unknown function (DUF5658)
MTGALLRNEALIPARILGPHSGLHLGREITSFTIASLLDFLMTWILLDHQNSERDFKFVESNPVAGYFLGSWGFLGLLGFKFGMVALIAAVCLVIAGRRFDTARRVLQFAALVCSLVVMYGASLAISIGR